MSVPAARPAPAARAGLIVALLLLSGFTVGLIAQPARAADPFRAPDASYLPAALLAPLSERLGFEPAALSEVVSTSPLRGSMEISVHLWPSQNSLFLPRPPSALPLSPAQVRAEYDPSPSVYTAWSSYLAGFGVQSQPLGSDGLEFTARGSVAGMDRAFATTVETGFWGVRAVQFPTPAPALPAGLAASTLSVLGLSSGWTQFTLPLRPAQTTQNLITPDEAHEAYGLSPLYNYSGTPHWASSVSIAVLLWGDGYDQNDISTFFSMYYPSGWPLPNVMPVPVDGAPSPGPGAVSDPSQAPIELTLDIEWAGSTAPGATIYPVYAPDGPASDNYSPSDVTLDDALTRAVGQTGVVVVSMSFATIDHADPALQASFESTFSSAGQQGITFVAASGDNGGAVRSGGACTTTAQPQYPAASPQVLSVGGTAPVLDVSLSGQVTGIDNEPAWNGSGGGFAADYGVPSWQNGVPAIAGGGHRGIPDVAGPAALNFLYFGGSMREGDGTSFAAPFWGGIIAEMDAIRGMPFGFINPRLYSIAESEPNGTVARALVDITAGSNCLDAAAPGWDPVTGWGTPRALLLYQNLVSSYVQLNLTLSSGSVSPGQSLTATALVLNTSNHRPLANLTVQFSSGAEAGYAGPCGGTFTSASGATNATGVVAVPLSIASCYIGSRASVSASILEGGFFGSNTTSVTVNLLGLAAFLTFIEQFPYNLIAFTLILLAAVLIGRSLSHRARRKAAAQRIRTAGTAAAPVNTASRPATPGTLAGPKPTPRPPPAALAPPKPVASAVAPVAAAAAQSGICRVCGFALDPALTFCPRCGNYVEAGGAGSAPAQAPR
ncbi:MAG: S53 family peptidase [Thermoplasmata archaeon]|nr:S53 family peptidase [Thermoplasmata archaeon]